jgi:hypothetical protein
LGYTILFSNYHKVFIPPDLQLPWPTDFFKVFTVFFIAYIIFDVVFIRVVRLSAIAWRRVDYIWLSMALIGVLGATSAGRQEVAANLISMETYRLESAREFMTSLAKLYSSERLCEAKNPQGDRTQERDRAQAEDLLRTQCQWFAKVHDSLQSIGDKDKKIDLSVLMMSYPQGASSDAITRVSDLLNAYNTSVDAVMKLKNLAKSSEWESMARLLGPLLIAIALALRMAKVTAEVKMDKEKLEESKKEKCTDAVS